MGLIQYPVFVCNAQRLVFVKFAEEQVDVSY